MQKEYSGGVWAVMERFGNISMKNELNGSNVHRLSNILTLSNEIHYLFDELYIWFEPIGVCVSPLYDSSLPLMPWPVIREIVTGCLVSPIC